MPAVYRSAALAVPPSPPLPLLPPTQHPAHCDSGDSAAALTWLAMFLSAAFTLPIVAGLLVAVTALVPQQVHRASQLRLARPQPAPQPTNQSTPRPAPDPAPASATARRVLAWPAGTYPPLISKPSMGVPQASMP
ncbi:MAG: hypothetical protein ORN28_07460 [Rhodoferax sp.]|nr:hypothetical protein [Rhodoferax sp.]